MRQLAITSLLAASFTVITHTASAAPTLSSNHRISPSSEIKFTFDKAIVTKEKVGTNTANQLIKITPHWDGELHWKTQNVAIFRPSKASSLGTSYQFNTIKNAHHLDNSQIPQTHLGKRSTFDFEIRRSYVMTEAYEGKRPAIFLNFNQDIDSTAAAPFFFFESKDGKRIAAETTQATWGATRSAYYAPASWNQRYQLAIAKAQGLEPKLEKLKDETVLKNCLVVRSIHTLPAGENWTLHALAGIPDVSKTTKLAEEDHFSVGSKYSFTVKSIKAYTVPNEPRFIRVHFNTRLSEQLKAETLKNVITVKPSIGNVRFELGDKHLDLYGDFSQQDAYRVFVRHTMQGITGLPLTTSKNQAVEFEHIQPSMAIPSYSTAQLAKGQRKYPVETVNMQSVRVRLKALTLSQAVRAKHGYNEFLKNQARDTNGRRLLRSPIPFSLISGTVVHDQQYKLNNKLDTSETLVLDWNKILPKERSNMIFFLDVVGTGKEGVRPELNGSHHVQSFIQLTDIGLAWKLNQDEALLYCYSCETGKPLANVSLNIFNNDAQKLSSYKSDKDGIARLPTSNKPVHLTATLNGDSYIIPFDESLSTVSLWRFPVQYDWYKATGWQRETLIFTDRKLYKPGETVHLKGLVREKKDNDHRLPKLKNAQLTITDARDRILYEEKVSLSEAGSFDHTLQLPENNVGTHRLKLTFDEPAQENETWEENWVRERNSQFTSYFSVQEFRKNAFKVKSKLSQTKAGEITANVEANYYMGTSVSEGKLDWYLTTSSTGFYPAKYRDFYFGDHTKYDPYYWDYYYGYDDGNHYEGQNSVKQNASATLDKSGKFSINLKADAPAYPSPQKVSLIAEVTDGREQTITSNSSLTIHPSTHYLGLARIDSLLRVNQSNDIKLIAVDSKGELSKLDHHTNVVIERYSYESVKVRSADGRVTVNNRELTEVVAKFDLKVTADSSAIVPFTPTQTGKYTIRVESKDKDGNRIATASSYRVYGANEYPWAVETGMKIKLAPEKKHYKPGDTARILVMTPIEGTALVTVERSGVNRHYLRELKADNPIIEIPIEDEDAPNMYVSVLLIRGAQESPHKLKEPSLKLGYCNINVENQKDQLQIAFETPEESYRPGASVTISGTILDSQNLPVNNAEVVLYAEDNGVLDVIGYKMPKPLKHFNKKISLNVESGASLHSFLAEETAEDLEMINKSVMNKGYTIGGGGNLEQLKKKVRKNFDPCAIWKPSLKTDERGRFSVTFNAPDSLTSYRVMAIASAGGEQFGAADSEIVINKPLMLEPMAPRFANEGDTTQTKLYVANNSKLAGRWKVTLRSNSLTEFPGQSDPHQAEQFVDLEPGKAAYLSFDVAYKNTGTAEWTWSAEPLTLRNQIITVKMRNHHSDSMKSQFKILYPRPILKDAKLSKLGQDNRNLLGNINPDLLHGRGKIDLELSNNLLFRANGAADHLLNYPYG